MIFKDIISVPKSSTFYTAMVLRDRVRESGTDREKETGRERDRQAERKRQTGREKETERETHIKER